MERYKVVTLTGKPFADACRLLEDYVVASGYRPDCIIGIESGGLYVAEKIFEGVPHLSIRLGRPSSGVKKSVAGQLVSTLLRIMPRSVCDRLRIAEAKKLVARSRDKMKDPQSQRAAIREAAAKVSFTNATRYQRILIVDDAVDSGLTLAGVLTAVSKALPNAEVRTAVITITTEDPVLRPDFTLYDNQTLIRFPWSIDTLRRR